VVMGVVVSGTVADIDCVDPTLALQAMYNGELEREREGRKI